MKQIYQDEKGPSCNSSERCERRPLSNNFVAVRQAERINEISIHQGEHLSAFKPYRSDAGPGDLKEASAIEKVELWRRANEQENEQQVPARSTADSLKSKTYGKNGEDFPLTSVDSPAF